MIKDLNLLTKTLTDFIKSNTLIFKKQGVIIHLDGTLMSIVNVALAKLLGEPFKFKVVTCVFNHNKLYLQHIISLAKDLDVPLEVKDLSRDFDQLSIYKNAGQSVDLEISTRKRLIDLAINLEADKQELFPVSNLCYSQWCINFPNKSYQALDQLHPLNRLFFEELQQLAKHLGIGEAVIEREPSHYLYKNYNDKQVLGFTYTELELALRSPHSNIISVVRDRLAVDNRSRYLCPLIQRPSNLLS